MPDYVYALHDFSPENPDEVPFRAGDRIEVIERDDQYQDGWWQVSSLLYVSDVVWGGKGRYRPSQEVFRGQCATGQRVSTQYRHGPALLQTPYHCICYAMRTGNVQVCHPYNRRPQHLRLPPSVRYRPWHVGH